MTRVTQRKDEAGTRGVMMRWGTNCLRTVPTSLKVFLRVLLNVREKQILTSVIEIPKENWR